MDRVTYFAETDSRGHRQKFGIKTEDRARHFYVIGKTGLGKSTLLENLAVQDIQNGEGMAFIDPHGGTAEKLLEYIPRERLKDLIYFAPHDLEFPVAFNIMENLGKDKNFLVANGLMATFKKIWPDVWSARMEYILNNVLLALLEYPNSTLLGVNRMLSDPGYRQEVVDNVTDPSVRSFWVDEFANYTERMAAESVPAIQNKIGQFISNPLIRNIIGQPKSTFNLREVMDDRKILIMNLSKGRVGEINANLLGGMLITKIYLAAMSRADKTNAEIKQLPYFYFFVDEFQSFVNDTFADILSEARKYRLCLTMAHQYIEQMPEKVRDAVFGNVGTTVAFRVGPLDAEILEKLFMPTFTVEDIVNLSFAQIYLTLMIDGVGSSPFSARTLPPIPPPSDNIKPLALETSRKLYARPRAEVEGEIQSWHKPKEGSAEVKSEFRSESKGEGRGEGRPRDSGFRPRPNGAGRAASSGGSRGGERSGGPRGSGDRPSYGASARPRRSDMKEKLKEAIEVAPEAPSEPAVSLNNLKRGGGENGNRGQNMNSLRSALQGVLEENKKTTPIAEKVPGTFSASKRTESAPNVSATQPIKPKQAEVKNTQPEPEKPKNEIPEDVLKNLLKMD